MEKINIDRGITLNVIATDKFKTNYFSVNFVQNINNESAAYNALIPRVLLRGTKKHTDMAAIKIALDELYAASAEARVYKRGEYQVSGITASWLADRFAIDGTNITEGSLALIEEIIFDPFTEDGVFGKAYVESEKADLIDDIRAAINNKNSYAVIRCKEEMCKNEAYGISEYGTENDVEAISADSLFEAYKKMLATSRIEIFYVGSGDKEKLISAVKAMFAGKKRDYSPLKPTEVIRTVGETKDVTEEISAAQGKLSLGFRTDCVVGEEGYSAFPVFVEMYGNSPVSKLFMNVREKLSLCYYCRAIPDGIKGTMIVSGGIEVAKRQKAQDEILAQLENMKKGDFTEDELRVAKASLTNSYRELDDSPVALEGWYLTRRLSDLEDTHEAVCAAFMGVTKEQIIKVANKIKLDTVYFLEGTLAGEEEYDDE